MHCARRYFTGYGELARSKDIPPISEAMAEALDAVYFTASRAALRLEFREGDVQFVNNLAVLHAREGYVDGPGRQYVSSPPLPVLLLLPYPSLPCRWETRTELTR
jgi:hypothetical protein